MSKQNGPARRSVGTIALRLALVLSALSVMARLVARLGERPYGYDQTAWLFETLGYAAVSFLLLVLVCFILFAAIITVWRWIFG